MNSERHERLYDLFRQACQLPADQQPDFIKEACGDDHSLRDELTRLLAHDLKDASVEQAPDVSGGTSARMLTRVGHYRIVKTLGRGGMGVVYLAVQDSPRRKVALKVLAPEATGPHMLDRFALESEVLARLQHPGIAHIYEAGAAEIDDQLQPFFAMEYVEGGNLLEYADGHQLDDSQRLDLLVQLCQAVHHAHQKGVIHRDLKPANILVTESGQLKVLDFGVARLTGRDTEVATRRTKMGELIGTIPYMSPEQATGDANALDVRSDVYALGVVAYELLSGRLPYELRERLIHEAVRIVRDEPHRPLSQVHPRLRGDVETIIGKALEKEPDRRYQSALGLAEDIQRYLNSEPIAARPPSAIYQLRKFAKRNTTLVGSAAAIFAVIFFAAILLMVLSLQLASQRDHAVAMQAAAEHASAEAVTARELAEHEAKIATAVSGFLQDVFAQGSPYVGKHDATIKEALDYAAQRVDEKLAEFPEAAVAVRLRLSDTYYSWGQPTEALREAESALEHARKLPQQNMIDMAAAHAAIGQIRYVQGITEEAGSQLKQALQLFDQADAQDEAREHPLRVAAMVSYAAVLIADEDYAAAAELLEEAYDLRKRDFGETHPYTLTVLNNLAMATRRMGSLEEAERLARQNVEAHEASVGPTHPNTITGIYNHADVLRELGRLQESEQQFARSIQLGKEHLPTNHFLLGLYRNGYGELLCVAKRYEDAERELLAGYHMLREQLGAQHRHTQRAIRRLVALYEATRKSDEASEWKERLAADS